MVPSPMGSSPQTFAAASEQAEQVRQGIARIRAGCKDSIYHPSHYTQGTVECIDAMRSCMEPAEFQGYLRGAAMKYLWRFRVKGNAKQDLEKARWYLNRLIQELG